MQKLDQNMLKLNPYLIDEIEKKSDNVYDVIVMLKDNTDLPKGYEYLEWEGIGEFYIVRLNINDVQKLISEPQIKRITVGSRMRIV